MIGATEALGRLQAGNARFAEGLPWRVFQAGQERRSELVDGQKPFAIILGCSDSRVPAELIFDQGLGDLFVIRVAGNIVAPSLVGSIEYAVEQFGTRLVVVLGHSHCGAVTATLDRLRKQTGPFSENLLAVVDRIRPNLKELLEENRRAGDEELLARAVRLNVEASTQALREESELLAELERNDGLKILAAEYCLESGRVEFWSPEADQG
jgi:carbonic anhydrase